MIVTIPALVLGGILLVIGAMALVVILLEMIPDEPFEDDLPQTDRAQDLAEMHRNMRRTAKASRHRGH